VLSVIAQQIMTLQGAVMRKETRVIFEDTDIYVDPEFAVFITMNPGESGTLAHPTPPDTQSIAAPHTCLLQDTILYWPLSIRGAAW
jgi:dynein heavy chain, axonemal